MEPTIARSRIGIDEREPVLGAGGLNWIMVLVLVGGVAFWSAVILGVVALV
jgi:hypothetical protein